MNQENQGKPVVAITGATGLVGLNVAKFLVANGYRVIGIIRDASKVAALKADGIETRIADVQNKAQIEAGVAGADVVVHAAATVDPFGSREQIFLVNVEGTRSVLEASKKAGAKQFILISSLSVITGQGDQYNVDESAPLKPCGESYADSKVEAEKVVMAEASSNRIAVTSLRPGFIYGPGERAWMPRLINSIATGKAMLIDGGKKETNVVYVENLARATQAALLNERAYGQVYNLTDGEKISKKDLFDAIADGLNLPRVTKVVPGVVAKTVCEIVSNIAPMMGESTQRKLARYSRAAFRLAGINQGFSVAKAERELGYGDRIPFAQGMGETLKTFNSSTKPESVVSGR